MRDMMIIMENSMNFRYRVAFILSIAVIFTACDSSRESSMQDG